MPVARERRAHTWFDGSHPIHVHVHVHRISIFGIDTVPHIADLVLNTATPVP